MRLGRLFMPSRIVITSAFLLGMVFHIEPVEGNPPRRYCRDPEILDKYHSMCVLMGYDNDERSLTDAAAKVEGDLELPPSRPITSTRAAVTRKPDLVKLKTPMSNQYRLVRLLQTLLDLGLEDDESDTDNNPTQALDNNDDVTGKRRRRRRQIFKKLRTMRNVRQGFDWVRFRNMCCTQGCTDDHFRQLCEYV